MCNLQWLADIFEEKSVFILDNNWEGYLTPRIELEVKDQNFANTIKQFIYNMGCTCHLKSFDSGQKPYIRITILGLKRCKNFLEKTISSWKTEKFIKKSKLLLDYINYRLNTELKEKRTEQDYKILNQLKQIE